VLFGSEYALTLAFVVLIILLLVRPHGLLGVKGF
jgi:branched-chain amino acid transport system permease protein